MKPIFWVIVALLVLPFIVTAALFADGTLPLPTDDWTIFMNAIRGKDGLLKFFSIAVLVQILLFMWRDRFMKLSGRGKLITVQAMTIIFGIAALKLDGFDWQSAFMHANTVGAFQVFAHQLIKQWTDKGEPRYVLPNK